MESRLKERLTGAAIVVALVVLLVPEMFRGQRGDGAARPGSSAEGPPVRSYTIDLTNRPARTEPLPSSAPAARDTDQAAAAAPSAVAAGAPPAPPAPPAGTRPASAHPPPRPAPAAPPGAATPPSQGGWSVQLGLFAKRENAERLMHAALAKGFTVGIAGPDAKGLYRVHATGLADRAAAQALSERLHARGLAASIAAPP